MKIWDLKKWVANIPESMDEASLFYLDTGSFPDELHIVVDSDNQAIISERVPGLETSYEDLREKK